MDNNLQRRLGLHYLLLLRAINRQPLLLRSELRDTPLLGALLSASLRPLAICAHASARLLREPCILQACF